LADFKAPFTTVAYGTGVPPEGTAEPNPVSPYVFNRHLSSWQVKQNHERSVQTSANLMWDHRLHRLFKLGMPILQGKVILPEVKEILINHEASMARRIKENLSVDIRGNTLLETRMLQWVMNFSVLSQYTEKVVINVSVSKIPTEKYKNS